MERNNCFVCGGVITKKSHNSYWCDTCEHLFFENPRPTSDLLLFDKAGRFLLAKRAYEPSKGKWDVPGGFVDPGDDLESSARREIMEELGLDETAYGELHYVASRALTYEWHKETYQLVANWFVARLKGSPKVVPQDDVSEAKFFTLEDLPQLDLSLPDLRNIITKAAKIINGQ